MISGVLVPIVVFLSNNWFHIDNGKSLVRMLEPEGYSHKLIPFNLPMPHPFKIRTTFFFSFQKV